jgi:hypothetical protein
MTPSQEIQLCFDFREEEPAEPQTPPGEKQLERLLIHSYRQDLSSSSWRARKKGAKGLGELGPAASVAVPELEKLLSDPDHNVREVAKRALALITKEQHGTRIQS